MNIRANRFRSIDPKPGHNTDWLARINILIRLGFVDHNSLRVTKVTASSAGGSRQLESPGRGNTRPSTSPCFRIKLTDRRHEAQAMRDLNEADCAVVSGLLLGNAAKMGLCPGPPGTHY